MIRRLVRFMKMGIVAVSVLVLMLLCSGGWSGQYVSTAKVAIDRQPQEVFPWLSDPDLMRQWLPGLTEVIPLSAGGPGLGARYRQVIVEQGNRMEFETEITDFKPPREIAVLISADPFEVHATYQLERTDRGTSVMLTTRSQYRQALVRLFSPLINLIASRQSQENLGHLKRCVEEAALAPTTSNEKGLAVFSQ